MDANNYELVQGNDNLFYLKLLGGLGTPALARKMPGFDTEQEANTFIENTVQFLKENHSS